VALGEPVGPVAERREMIWAFREECDRHGAIPVFYAIRRDSLADFIDCGLVAAKIGENAVIDLDSFTLVGRSRQDLRTARSRAAREGLSFAVISAQEVRACMDELQAISDSWLERHQGEEKGFSLGRFDPAYVGRFDAAVLRRGDEIVAFTNLWRTADGRRLAVDLMRYAPDAPPGAMEALLVDLLLWAQESGFQSCDLGRTPLAGLEASRLASFMTLVGSLIYTHAGKLYGFDGLRRFKAKFFPRWESTYIAAPTGWRLPAALGDAALLSSGGVRGLFRDPPRAQKKGRAQKARPVHREETPERA
jgi:phosphatidylglycerol lysyltransferase